MNTRGIGATVAFCLLASCGGSATTPEEGEGPGEELAQDELRARPSGGISEVKENGAVLTTQFVPNTRGDDLPAFVVNPPSSLDITGHVETLGDVPLGSITFQACDVPVGQFLCHRWRDISEPRSLDGDGNATLPGYATGATTTSPQLKHRWVRFQYAPSTRDFRAMTSPGVRLIDLIACPSLPTCLPITSG